MKNPGMIVLVSDFSIKDPYVGQIKSVLLNLAPSTPIIDLLHDVADYNIKAAAYLLPALVDVFPLNSLFLCVIDPGVGSDRPACVAQIDQRWYVGPDNGLFDVLRKRSRQVRWWRIPPARDSVAPTFHGRDIFAPIAAQIANADMSGLEVLKLPPPVEDWPDDLAEIVYIDHYGNLISGYRFQQLPLKASVVFNGVLIHPARTFSDVAVGEPFYYENANRLLEIAVNQGSAQALFNAKSGDRLTFEY